MPYLPHTQEEIDAMLGVVGAESLEALFATIPEACCCRLGMQLPGPVDEWQLNRHMDALAATMATAPDYRIFLGAGSYDHFIPAAAVRSHPLGISHLLHAVPARDQPGNAAGHLRVPDAGLPACTGMDVANASLYDGATAIAEALLMAVRKTGKKRVAVSRAIHPNYRRVIATYFHPAGCEVVLLPSPRPAPPT